MSDTGTFPTTSAVPMIGLPSGWSPKIASASTSCTLSDGSSSYIAISSITTCRSAATATGPAASAAGATAAALVTGAHRGELRRGLAGDLRVVGQPQPDAAALAVDLDHADVELLAAVEHVLDGVDPLAGRHVRDVQQAVGALGELDERAERGRLHDLAGVLVADLDLLGHLADAIHQGVALLAGLGVHQHLAGVVHVDLGLVLLGERANRLAALADEHPDLLRVDLHRGDARRVLRQLAAGGVDHLGH